MVEVFEGGGEDVNAGAFSVKLELQSWMRVSKKLHVEFQYSRTSSRTHMLFLQAGYGV